MCAARTSATATSIRIGVALSLYSIAVTLALAHLPPAGDVCTPPWYQHHGKHPTGNRR
jgi:hypothetical protein